MLWNKTRGYVEGNHRVRKGDGCTGFKWLVMGGPWEKKGKTFGAGNSLHGYSTRAWQATEGTRRPKTSHGVGIGLALQRCKCNEKPYGILSRQKKCGHFVKLISVEFYAKGLEWFFLNRYTQALKVFHTSWWWPHFKGSADLREISFLGKVCQFLKDRIDSVSL